MNQTEISLEFDKIKSKWAECALTQAAREEIERTDMILSETDLAARLRETTESRQMLEKCGTPPLVSLEGIREILTAACKGLCLTPEELERMTAALVAVKRLKEYLERGKTYGIPLAYYEENLDPLEELQEQLRYQIWNEQVSDNASKLLKSLRGDILRAEDKMRERADAVMRANKECMSDHFSTIRNGHVCIPVKKEFKFKISGILIDKSSTGSTLFIEPSASARYYEELQELRIDEENEVRRILYELSALVAENGEIMETNIRMMEKMDFIFSKGKFSESCGGREPKIIGERRIFLRNARHPLMDRSACVPLQFSLGEGVNGIVITGPNTGGKTVALKTVALSCLMAQCGLHIPCEEAEICMNRNILCDIGDGQNLSENLSTFSAHIVNVLDILRKVTPESLVVMDELGSGTDPAEGMGIAIAILEELKKSEALFLVTTHYPEVKTYAEREQTIVNARMTFDKENLKPMYQMVIGEAGESCAFYIAGRLGMPAYMLRRAAREAYGEGRSLGSADRGRGGLAEESAFQGRSMPAGESTFQGRSMPVEESTSRGGGGLAEESAFQGRSMPVEESTFQGRSMPAEESTSRGRGGLAEESTFQGRSMPAEESASRGRSMPAGESVSWERSGPVEENVTQNRDDLMEESAARGRSTPPEREFAPSGSRISEEETPDFRTGKACPEYFENGFQEELKKENVPRLQRAGTRTPKKQPAAFRRGDSVMIYPDKKIGIVCQPVNDKGVLQVQLPGRKIWINHKRVKLQVAAEELYPEDYDFSIIFDTVENRKLRHQMERKYVEGAEISVL